MLYSLTKEQLKNLSNYHFLADFNNAEMLSATFKTSIDIVKEIIPRPLIPIKEVLATAFIARYPETNFGCPYNEGALFLHCQYKGEMGLYCLSMPVDDDMGMVGGRETYGYPKKMADKIKLEQDGNNISGSVVRKGVEILKIEGKLGDETSENPFGDSAKSVKDWDGVLSYRLLSFLFKYFISPGGSSFDYIPRLIREPILLRRISKTLKVSGKVILSSTPVDPLGEIPVGEITSMFYGKWHNTMLPGKVVARIWNPLKFVKNAYFKTDVVPTLLSNYDPNSLARYKEVMKIAKRF